VSIDDWQTRELGSEFEHGKQFNTERRLRQIHDAHEHYQSVRQQAYDPKVRRMLQQDEINDYVFQSAKAMVYEIAVFANEGYAQKGAGKGAWSEHEIGPLQFDPPQEVLDVQQRMELQYGDATVYGTGQIPITGLKQFIELDPPYTVNWGVVADVGIDSEERMIPYNHSIPIKVSDRAFLYAQHFLHGMGVDAKVMGESIDADDMVPL
jgi:hypothetical protein